MTGLIRKNTSKGTLIRLILPNKQDPDPPDNYLKDQAKKLSYRKSRLAGQAFLLVGIVMLFIIPISTGAGLFSLIFDNTKETEKVSYNSQNIQLLQAAVALGAEARGGGDITIVGGMALLPEVGPLGMTLDIDDEIPLSGQFSVYVVREGDTISQIAELFEVSTGTVRSANYLGPRETIRPGQVLTIPPVSGITYKIKKNDTLESVAKKFKGDVQKIRIYNGVTDDSKLVIGDEILIPDGKTSVYSSKKKSSRSSVRGGKSSGKLRKAPAGYYIRPVNGRVTQRNHGPYMATDIGAPTGTLIVAMAAGTVIVDRRGGWGGGFGTYLIIQHNNSTQTLYAHNSRNVVRKGQYVKQGQVIGYVGSTGRSTGAHLHFEVRGTPPIQNPRLY